MEVWRKYGVETVVLFPLIDAGAQDFESTPVAHAAGDSQISKDEGAFANTTNAFAHEGNGMYSLTVSATEMQAARIMITIIDQTSPKAWEDQAVIISTYGNASAQHAFDLDTATQDVNVAQISGDSTAADNAELAFDGNGYGFTGCTMPTTTSVTNRVTANTDQIEGADATDTIDARVLAQLQGIELDHLMSAACDGNVITGNVVDHSALACLAAIGNDISDYDASTDSLEALGTGVAATTPALVADAVWDEAMSGHTNSGSFGDGIADIPDNVWDEEMDANAPADCDTAREYMNVIVSTCAGVDSEAGDWGAKSLGGDKTRVQGTLSAAGKRVSVDTLDGT